MYLERCPSRSPSLELFYERYEQFSASEREWMLKIVERNMTSDVTDKALTSEVTNKALTLLIRARRKPNTQIIIPPYEHRCQFINFLERKKDGNGGLFSSSPNPFISGIFSPEFGPEFFDFRQDGKESPSFRKACTMISEFFSGDIFFEIASYPYSKKYIFYTLSVQNKKFFFDFLINENSSGFLQLFQMIGSDYFLLLQIENPVKFFVEFVEIANLVLNDM